MPIKETHSIDKIPQIQILPNEDIKYLNPFGPIAQFLSISNLNFKIHACKSSIKECIKLNFTSTPE